MLKAVQVRYQEALSRSIGVFDFHKLSVWSAFAKVLTAKVILSKAKLLSNVSFTFSEFPE
jgi:hypothetical protein